MTDEERERLYVIATGIARLQAAANLLRDTTPAVLEEIGLPDTARRVQEAISVVEHALADLRDAWDEDAEGEG